MQRTMFATPFTHTTTFDSGKLIPFFLQECIPGDTVKVDSTALIARMQTPIVPVMDSAFLDYFYFFIPTRLVWNNFKAFMGENPNAAWDTNLPNLSIPQMNLGTHPVVSGSNGDYLGLPLMNFGSVSAIPFRSLRQVWNDWFRVTALQDPLLVNKGDTEPVYSVGPSNQELLPVRKFPDYFTTCLPAPQYGEAVSIGVGSGLAPVVTSSGLLVESSEIPMYLKSLSGIEADIFDTSYPLFAGNNGVGYFKLGSSSEVTSTTSTMDEGYYPANLGVDLSAIGAISINDLRVAFQIQAFKEAQARGGTRYVEILESIYNVKSPDARLQRSEYLGGDRVLINMQQVLQTSSSTEASPQGNASGFSKTASRGGSFTYAVPEHGIVLGVLCVRPTHSYQQGVDRYWTKKDIFDFYNPLLANIGEQPVYQSEIFANTENFVQNPQKVFGFQEAWADYRWKRSYVSGEMRSNIDNSLDIYHYADDYTEAPTLSASWIQEDESLIDRTLAVSSDVSNQFRADIFVDLKMIRPMPPYSVPGTLLDHA